MKSIELNTAAVDNAGRRIEAGDRIAVGTRPNQIDADRAKDLVARASATAVREKKAAAKTAAKPKSTAKKAPAAKVPPAGSTSPVVPDHTADAAKP